MSKVMIAPGRYVQAAGARARICAQRGSAVVSAARLWRRVFMAGLLAGTCL